MKLEDITDDLKNLDTRNDGWYYFKIDNINEYLFMGTHSTEGISLIIKF